MLEKIVKYVMLGLLFSFVGAYGAWLYYEPMLKAKWAEAKEKDPDKHAVMEQELKAFHLSKAKKLYDEIDAMTYEEVLDLRHKNFYKKRRKDKKFRIAEWEKELELRAKTKEERAEIHQTKAETLHDLRTKREFKTAQSFWRKTSSMEKGVLLRSNCVKYLRKQRLRSQIKSDSPELPSVSVQLAPPRGWVQTPSGYCAQLIPDTIKKDDVLRIVSTLKKKMNYYFFSQMMEEIGIAQKDVYTFDLQLDHMSSDFADS